MLAAVQNVQYLGSRVVHMSGMFDFIFRAFIRHLGFTQIELHGVRGPE